jgi:hypothetical protein
MGLFLIKIRQKKRNKKGIDREFMSNQTVTFATVNFYIKKWFAGDALAVMRIRNFRFYLFSRVLIDDGDPDAVWLFSQQ